ncbi:MAG: hypothetical protein RSB38_05235 [Oscillospiraceae bacterium]
MREDSEAVSFLVTEIKQFIKRVISHSSFDVTKQGIVTAVLGENKYSVKIEGTVCTVPSCSSFAYSVNDNVLVTYIQNDKKRKYITGKVA